MERLSFVVVSALLFTGGLNSLQAQRGFGGHQSGGYSFGYSSPGTHYAGNPPLAYHSPLSNVSHPVPIGVGHPYSGYTGINRGVFSDRGDHSRNHGYGYGYGPLLYPYYLSTFDNFDSSYAYGNPGPDPAMQNADVNANALGEQISQLAAEVEALRNERNAPNANGGPERIPYAPPAPSEDNNTASASVTLVLHSGKQVQLKSYAVMGKSIWDFSSSPAKRIALSNVDVNASKTATEATGGEFPEIH